MSAKRGFWSIVGKILWTIISFVFKIAARLGSKWARTKLDEHKARNTGGAFSRMVHHRRKN